MLKTFLLTTLTSLTLLIAFPVDATDSVSAALTDLRNYRVNSDTMVSAGLPDEKHFRALKSLGVTTVIDLIPGDRSDEAQLLNSMQMDYYNVQVEWQNPTLDNFIEYVGYMQQSSETDGITLTHCQLNWRGAVFTYLYKVTQLDVPEPQAREEMRDVWQPNRKWQTFIDQVLAHYAS